MKNFLGLDLSLTGTGVVYIHEDESYTDYLVKSSKNGDRPVDEVRRLNLIVKQLKNTLNDEIEFAAIEGIAFGVRKSVSLAQLSALNYMVRQWLENMRIPFVIIAPMTLKKFVTGTGKAGKELMMLETEHRYGAKFTDDNLCDAYGLAMMARGLYTDEGLTEDQKCAIVKLRKQL